MPTVPLQVSYRPLRVGFVVRSGSLDDIRAAGRLRTLLWGGHADPVIELGDDPDSARRTVEDFAVDVLFPVADEPPLHEFIAAFPHLAWPIGESEILAPRGMDNEIGLTLVDVEGPIMDIAERIHQDRLSRFRLFEWDDGDPHATYFCVAFGEYHGEHADRYRALFEGSLLAETASPWGVDFSDRDIPSPLYVTGYGLEPSFISRDRLGVVVGDVQNARHLAAYWNLGAAGYRVDFFTGNAALDCGLNRHVRGHLARYPYLPDWQCQLQVFSLGESDIPEQLRADIAAIEQQVGYAARLIRHDGLAAAWHAHDPVPLYRASPREVFASAEVEEAVTFVHVPLPELPFGDPSGGASSQRLVISIGSYSDRGFEGTLRLPNIPPLNRFFSKVALGIREVRVERDGFGVIASDHRSSLTLRPLGIDELLTEVFSLAGLRLEQTPEGIAAGHTIRQLGHIQRCRVFRLPGVRCLVASRDAHMGLMHAQASAFIRDRFATARPFYVSGQRLDDPRRVFDFLLERSIFVAGLELRCPHCAHRSILPPRLLDDEVRCPKCRHDFLLAPHVKQERDQWRFILSGLLEQGAQHALPDDRQHRPPELVAVLLTLVWFHDFDSADLMIDANYRVTGNGIEGELDLIGVERRHDGGVSVLIAECRTEGEILDGDVAKLSDIADRFRAVGLTAHPAFALIRPTITEVEAERLRAMRDRLEIHGAALPQSPILLLQDDLEAGEVARRDEVPGFYPGVGLAALAEASNRLHLA